MYVDCLSSEYDNFFKSATAGGWANESSGDVEAPTGWFAKMTVLPTEVASVIEAFQDEFNEIELREPDKITELTGFFGCEITNLGFIWVYRFASQSDLDEWYQAKVDEFDAWDNAEAEIRTAD